MSFAPIYDKDGNQITPEERYGIPEYNPRTHSLITGRPRDLSEAGFGGRLSGFIRGLIEAQDNPDYEPTSRIGQLLAALVGNRNQTPDRSDVIIDDTPRAPTGNIVRNETERSAVRTAFEGMASELGMSGPEFWNLVSDANLEVRNGRASSALDVVAARLGVDEDVLINKGLQHGFTMENGQIRVSDRALGRTEQAIGREGDEPDMDAVRRYIPNYDFLREQSQRYNAYTSSNGVRQEIALLYTDENGRLTYVPTPEELDARVKIAQSPYARYMGQDGSMQMIALVDENGRYIPSPLDGGITQEASSSQSHGPNKNLLADFERPDWAGAHQARHDDQEPQGNRVNASGQEATIVAQR